MVLCLSEGQMSDYNGAALMLPAMPKAKVMLAEGLEKFADWYRQYYGVGSKP